MNGIKTLFSFKDLFQTSKKHDSNLISYLPRI